MLRDVIIAVSSWSGVVCAVGVYATLVLTARRFHSQGSVGQTTPVFFLLSLLNAATWVVYGSMLGSPQIMLPNAWGLACATFSAASFMGVLALQVQRQQQQQQEAGAAVVSSSNYPNTSSSGAWKRSVPQPPKQGTHTSNATTTTDVCLSHPAAAAADSSSMTTASTGSGGNLEGGGAGAVTIRVETTSLPPLTTHQQLQQPQQFGASAPLCLRVDAQDTLVDATITQPPQSFMQQQQQQQQQPGVVVDASAAATSTLLAVGFPAVGGDTQVPAIVDALRASFGAAVDRLMSNTTSATNIESCEGNGVKSTTHATTTTRTAPAEMSVEVLPNGSFRLVPMAGTSHHHAAADPDVTVLTSVRNNSFVITTTTTTGTAAADVALPSLSLAARLESTQTLFTRGIAAAAVVLGIPALLFIAGYTTAAVNLVGTTGVCIATVMFAGPLDQVGWIVRNRCSAPLSPLTTSVGIINSLCWSVFGLLVADPYVYAPNIAAVVLCLFQLGLILRYPQHPPAVAAVEAAAAAVIGAHIAASSGVAAAH